MNLPSNRLTILLVVLLFSQTMNQTDSQIKDIESTTRSTQPSESQEHDDSPRQNIRTEDDTSREERQTNQRNRRRWSETRQRKGARDGRREKLKDRPRGRNKKINENGSKIADLRSLIRSVDGSGNNPNNPLWGATNSEQIRLCPANYIDGLSQINTSLPNPREVSNRVGVAIDGDIDDPQGLNHMNPVWGQFIAHDLVLTRENATDTKLPIIIPQSDRQTDPEFTVSESMSFSRSQFSASSEVRTQINALTAWFDAEMVYGSNIQLANSLRSFSEGKLRMTDDNMLIDDGKGKYLTGDPRAHENVILTSLHTIFAREHNRLCDRILSENSSLSDEEVYQAAKNYVAGLIQHITYSEYLPDTLGQRNFKRFIGKYVYDPNVNPNINTEFSTAAFRFSHPNLKAPFQLRSNNGTLTDSLDMKQQFIIISSEQMDEVLNGAALQIMKRSEIPFTQQLRNFIFRVGNSETIFDLLAFDIMRNRDHGLNTVNCVRQVFGLSPITEFGQTINNDRHADILEGLYQSVDNLDLVMAIFGERSVRGGIIGELGMRIVAEQFKNIRNGDRFWFENAYPDSVVEEIRATTLADVINRNSNANIGADAFRV